MGQYETLAIPGFIVALFAIKYLVQRCYAKKEQRLRDERLRIIEDILGRRVVNESNSGSRTRTGTRSDVTPSPPPEFESALRSSIAVIYIEDEPPPSYEEYQKSEELKRSSSTASQRPPAYLPNPTGDREERPALRPDGHVL